MPDPHPFPTQRAVASENSIYGRHGDTNMAPPMTMIELPFSLYLYGHRDRPLTRIKAHSKVADSLAKVFRRLSVAYPTEQERIAAGITTFDGIYNPRRMRGGTAWSMHAWAIAIDLDAGRNGNQDHWPVKASMPIQVMECFAREGWTAAGAFWSRDAMHFQATQP